MNDYFDKYGIRARLFPALLCSFPYILIKYYLLDKYLDVSLSERLFAVVVQDTSMFVVLTYLLAQVNRYASKAIFQSKSDFQTTEMLLNSNSEVSSELRSKISQKVELDFNLKLPTLTEEQKNIKDSKTRIKEIVHQIIHKTGDGTLLLKHNIEYGFARNLIGGSVLSFVLSLTLAFVFHFLHISKVASILSIALSFLYFVPVLFSKIILDHYGRGYAHILFREYLATK